MIHHDLSQPSLGIECDAREAFDIDQTTDNNHVVNQGCEIQIWGPRLQSILCFLSFLPFLGIRTRHAKIYSNLFLTHNRRPILFSVS